MQICAGGYTCRVTLALQAASATARLCSPYCPPNRLVLLGSHTRAFAAREPPGKGGLQVLTRGMPGVHAISCRRCHAHVRCCWARPPGLWGTAAHVTREAVWQRTL